MAALRTAFALLTAACLGSCAAAPPDLGDMTFADEPLLGKAVWHDLITEDLEAASRFYSGLFGWTLEPARGAAGQGYLVARDGNIYVAGLLQARRSAGSNVSRWLPYVSVSNVDSATARVTDAGGTVLVAPRDVPLGRVAAITDEEGAVLGLARSSFGDPDDATTAGAVNRVVWNELLADDPAEAARFYERVFGYQAREIERRGGDYILLHASGGERAGILAKPVADWKPVWLTYFGVTDPAAAVARVEALGGRVVAAPSPELREGTMAVVTDPSGAVLVLQQWPVAANDR
ncbi:MAG TPA: VOC family protein [Woeseiaceae bacterium]|nr:VOC family protein [Woeseiaceae bacterium]